MKIFCPKYDLNIEKKNMFSQILHATACQYFHAVRILGAVRLLGRQE